MTLREAIAAFGSNAKAKLSNVAAAGEPEDQLRAPLEHLVEDLEAPPIGWLLSYLAALVVIQSLSQCSLIHTLPAYWRKLLAELCGLPRSAVAAVGESSLADLKTRPDYAITVKDGLIGFIEVKAPGKGADPRRFKDRHDKQQWEKLQSLPNLIYTDGNEFSLWRSSELVSLVRLIGDVETSGTKLDAPPSLLSLFEDFIHWHPVPPRDAKQLAEVSARLCRLLREEVTEQLAMGSPALTALATDWRKLLFPEASDAQFADGYAQAVTFGMLMARAREIELSEGLDQVGRQLGRTNSLIGTALRILTDDAENQATLKTSLGTLTRVLDAVHWPTISKGDPDAWLYFYEDFLEVYDNKLRKQTGSYYTPPEVVSAMIRLVDEVLKDDKRFKLPAALVQLQDRFRLTGYSVVHENSDLRTFVLRRGARKPPKGAALQGHFHHASLADTSGEFQGRARPEDRLKPRMRLANGA